MTTALEGDEGSASRPGRSLPPGRDPVPIVEKALWAPGPVWTGAEDLASTGIQSPDPPVRNQSLNRLRYPTHKEMIDVARMSSLLLLQLLLLLLLLPGAELPS